MEVTEKKNEELLKITEVDNTPFTLIETNGRVNIVMKNQIVEENTFDSVEDAKKYIESKPWKLILIAAHLYGVIVNNELEKMEELSKNQEN